jgi:predicted pyridoxine 5'-phosphate oxidase superfamily flavin-nucleotide-binding protein
VGKVYDEIDDGLRRFLEAQHLFFVATAPSGAEGHVNCSPKGLDGFRVLGPRTVGYLDYVGSGVETIAHVRENGRIVLMFCAFEGAPRIVRLHGRGRVIEPHDAAFAAASAPFPRASDSNVRAVIAVDVTRIADSCGYGVPLYRYEGERTQLPAWAERKGADGVADYKRERNATSLDGLAGLDPSPAPRR